MASIAPRLREGLLEAADVGRAAELAAGFTNQVNDALNDLGREDHPARITVATSLVARALLARGILQMAGDWWADLAAGRAPAPEYFQAIKSIADELPPELADGMIDTRTGKEC